MCTRRRMPRPRRSETRLEIETTILRKWMQPAIFLRLPLAANSLVSSAWSSLLAACVKLWKGGFKRSSYVQLLPHDWVETPIEEHMASSSSTRRVVVLSWKRNLYGFTMSKPSISNWSRRIHNSIVYIGFIMSILYMHIVLEMMRKAERRPGRRTEPNWTEQNWILQVLNMLRTANSNEQNWT